MPLFTPSPRRCILQLPHIQLTCNLNRWFVGHSRAACGDDLPSLVGYLPENKAEYYVPPRLHPKFSSPSARLYIIFEGETRYAVPT
ncbi:hypothetical protein VUR80DRAFT_2952 [Thermomyces stellatus]